MSSLLHEFFAYEVLQTFTSWVHIQLQHQNELKMHQKITACQAYAGISGTVSGLFSVLSNRETCTLINLKIFRMFVTPLYSYHSSNKSIVAMPNRNESNIERCNF